jgi:EpsI family protein
MISMRITSLLAIGLLFAGAVAGLSSVFAWVHGAWWSFAGVGPYSHGYLTLALAIWIGWKRWREDPPRTLGPAWWGIVPLSLFVAAMAVMELLYINSSRALLLPPLFLSSVLLVFGWEACRRLLSAALLLYFALLPFWVLEPALQAMATGVMSFLMSFTGIPVHIQGFFIEIPAGTFEIASACSGLSFLMSAITFAAFYGIAFFKSWWHRGVLMVAAIVAAMVSNWIRIWTLILIGQYTGLQHWLIDDHYVYGWVLFGIGLVPVLFLARKLDAREHRAVLKDADERTRGRGHPSRAALPGSALAAGTVGAMLLAIPRFFAAEALPAGENGAMTLPDSLAGGARRIDAQTSWRPYFHDTRQALGVYEFEGRRVEAFVAFYEVQGRTRHLFHGANRPFGGGWQESSREAVRVSVNSEAVEVNQVIGELIGEKRVIWYWYEVGGRTATHRLDVKIQELRSLARGRRGGAIKMVSMACYLDCREEAELLSHFVYALIGSGAQ